MAAPRAARPTSAVISAYRQARRKLVSAPRVPRSPRAAPAPAAPADLLGSILESMGARVDVRQETGTSASKQAPTWRGAGGGGGGGGRGWGGGWSGDYRAGTAGGQRAAHARPQGHQGPYTGNSTNTVGGWRDDDSAGGGGNVPSSYSPAPRQEPDEEEDLVIDTDKYDPTEPTEEDSPPPPAPPAQAPLPPPPALSAVLDNAVRAVLNERGLGGISDDGSGSDGDCPNFSIYSATSVHIASGAANHPALAPPPALQLPDEPPNTPPSPEPLPEYRELVSKRCPITPSARNPIKIKLNTPSLLKRRGLYDDIADEDEEEPEVAQSAATQESELNIEPDSPPMEPESPHQNQSPPQKQSSPQNQSPPQKQSSPQKQISPQKQSPPQKQDSPKPPTPLSEPREATPSPTPRVATPPPAETSGSEHDECNGLEGGEEAKSGERSEEDVALPELAVSKMTESLSPSEDSRSYTPCLDERRPSPTPEAAEGPGAELGTELISDDEPTHMFSDEERPPAITETSPPPPLKEDGEEGELEERGRKKKKKEGKKDLKEKKKKKTEVAFKKNARGKERNYREKESSSSRSASRSRSRSRRRRRKDLERYDVRSVVGEKKRRVKDAFGRDVSPPAPAVDPERSPSPRRRRRVDTPPRRPRRSSERSPLRSPKHSPLRTPRKSLKGSPRRSPRRSPHRSPRRSLHRSPHRSPRRSLHRSPHRSPRRSLHRSPHKSPRRSPLRVIQRSPRRRSPERPAKRRRSVEPPKDKKRTKRKKKSASRTREEKIKKKEEKRRGAAARRKSASPAPRREGKKKKKRARKSPSPAALPAMEALELSPAWSAAGWPPPRSPAAATPPRRPRPACKEVFTSGDNILVSVSFQEQQGGERRRKRRRERPLARPALTEPAAKPVAIIDLERSPFRELTPSPKNVIVLSDSDGGAEPEAPPVVAPPAPAVTAAPAAVGPKTPPSPQEPAPAIEPAPDKPPPEATPPIAADPPSPASPASPSEPDAYDPFEPTRSPSPAPVPMTLEAAQRTNMSADEVLDQRPITPIEKVMAMLASQRAAEPEPPPQTTPAPAPAPPAPTPLPAGAVAPRVVLPEARPQLFPGKPSPIKSTPIKPLQQATSKLSALPLPPLRMDSPYSPGSSDFGEIFEPPGTAGSGGRGRDVFDALLAARPRDKQHRGKKRSSKTQVGVRLDDDKLKVLEELPSSAVELQVKTKFLKKLNRQERVVEEVKLVLKPHYNRKRLTKDQYKDILRRAVPKICHNKTGEINPTKIQALVEAYVKKVRKKVKLGLA